MTAIWQNSGTQWKQLTPDAFPDEATLHSLIEDGPQLLPLSGSPTVVIVGREVQLGSGYADLIGVEPNGRLVLLEIKLSRNTEARRAIVAQVLAYAAYLQGLEPESLERDILGYHLRERGHDSLAAAVAARDQGGLFDSEEFATTLRSGLAEGRFRLVLVLDRAPEELIRLVGYLESISDKILIDLVTVSSYRVGESTIVVPQRVDPERATTTVPAAGKPMRAKGREEAGSELFVATLIGLTRAIGPYCTSSPTGRSASRRRDCATSAASRASLTGGFYFPASDLTKQGWSASGMTTDPRFNFGDRCWNGGRPIVCAS